MIRSIPAIVAALQVAAPNFAPKQATAAHLQALARDGDFDPLTIVAYNESETGWRARAIGLHGGVEYVGLGQHRLLNYEPCRIDLGSVACEQVRTSLLDWRFNIGQTAQAIVTWREYCREKIGSALAKYWLQGLTGWDAKRKTTCGHRAGKPLSVPKTVLDVLKRRRELARIATNRKPGDQS